MRLKDIKPNPNNPRVLRDDKFQKLKQSITEFPKMMSLRPMVVDSDGIILGGNIRYRALQDLGFKEIPNDWVKRAEELTEDEKKRFIIADNVGFGDWDWDALANDWDVVDLEAWGLEIPNWSAGSELNTMNEDELDINEEFDPVGNSKGLHRIIFIFDSEDLAAEWYDKNKMRYDYRKFGGDNVNVWHVNLSTKYAK